VASSKSEKKKAKRKAKLKQAKTRKSLSVQRSQRRFLLDEAIWLRETGNYPDALSTLRQVLRQDPDNGLALHEMLIIGQATHNPSVEFAALEGLERIGQMPVFVRPMYCRLLMLRKRKQDARRVAEQGLALLPHARISGKRELRRFFSEIIDAAGTPAPPSGPEPTSRRQPEPAPSAVASSAAGLPANPVPDAASPEPKPPVTFAPVPVAVEMDAAAFANAMQSRPTCLLEDYDLTLQAHQLRLRETFDRLICLGTLRNVRSFAHQEETARKVLRRFRGRALLADEVGLGKTIEALMVLKEYVQRGMVKSALILTPASLTGQWNEELRDKFGLDFPSSDDPGFRAMGDAAWEQPFLVASINQAKSKKNYDLVTGREYDMVIVDEAHHLKNRNTLNWKLVNDLKKRFLLMLTATPVENNLMELFNLITLLKPGQLKTAGEFRREFMTRGDPTDPQNQVRLRGLLAEVMIRNTRAVARIEIPPRFAQTIRVNPGPVEQEIYERITALVQGIHSQRSGGSRLLLKTLLEEAGSSPRAVAATLLRMAEKDDLLPEQAGEIRAIHGLCGAAGGSRKNAVLLDLVRSSSDKAIVFVKYQATLQYLADFLEGERVPHTLFHGGLSGAQKEENIRRFEAEAPLLIATEVGGEGRNLQFCHRLINYDLPWNPMKIEQRVGRLHRIGQKHEVAIFNLCAAGSAEDYILEILDKKINMFEMVIGEIDMILGRIQGEQEFSDLILDIWAQTPDEDERRKAFVRLGSLMKRLKSGYEKTKVLDEKLFGENFEL
jgi:superfamily II DNA or RNA helicase